MKALVPGMPPSFAGPVTSSTIVSMDLASIGDLQLAMKLAGIKPNKNLGQHFLVDRPSLEAIMAAADLCPDDTVLEIGPGLGVMTKPLSERVARVVAVEADQTLSSILRRGASSNLEIVEADIMTYDLTQLPTDYKVVANIPYYITSKIIRLMMEASNPPSVMSLLIQKEVAERIVTVAGHQTILSLSVQYYARPEVVQVVERYNFWPAPNVDSAVLRIVRRPSPAFAADPTKLFRLIKASFGEKRKQLKNALAGGLNTDTQTTATLLVEAGIGSMARAQELDWSDWEGLYKAALVAGLLA